MHLHGAAAAAAAAAGRKKKWDAPLQNGLYQGFLGYVVTYGKVLIHLLLVVLLLLPQA